MDYKSLSRFSDFLKSISCSNLLIAIVCDKTRMDCVKIWERIENA